MTVRQILIVDDEPAIRQVLAAQLEREGYQVEHVGTGESALERLAKGDVDLALCDIRLPDVNGVEVLRRTRAAGVDTAFLVMTAYASVPTAIDAMKAGAFDYLIKPVRIEDLTHRLAQVSEVHALRAENQHLRSIISEPSMDVCMLPSPASQEVFRLASRMAQNDGTVLITGESGTGKGVVAHTIQHHSNRASARFVNVNCGAIPRELIESEFFGHLKGSFTGAHRAKKGFFLEADGGTLMLDEIGELSFDLQVKLLHAIEQKEVRPVGAERSRRVDVRIIAVTNRDLKQMVVDGTFREDLYYRLNVLHLHMPPLRERPQDVIELVRFNLSSRPPQLGLTGSYTIEAEAEELLSRYTWPGNIRELQNVMDRALILADDNHITIDELPTQMSFQQSHAGALSGTGKSLRDRVQRFEVESIHAAIEEANGDRRVAARNLGIGLSTLYRKLEEHEELVQDL